MCSPTAASMAAAVGDHGQEAGHQRRERRLLGLLGVADSAPNVRPWNAPWTTTMSPPGLALRASFRAASTASAPEFEK